MSNFDAVAIAFIVAAPEENTSSKGNTYWKARAVINKFERGEEKKYYTSITAFDPSPIRILSKARVGSALQVYGEQTIGVYQSKKTQEWLPSIDIVANSLTFLPTRRTEGDAPARTTSNDFDAVDDSSIPF